MKKSDLLISHTKDGYEIVVSGRANFEYGVPMRRFAQTLDSQHISKVTINMANCLGMDSTFMGILTMLALKLKKQGAVVEIINISQFNRDLLHTLGIEKLFLFPAGSEASNSSEAKVLANGEKNTVGSLDMAETVVDAHETLMLANEDNVEKFEQVTKFAKQDAERLRQQSKQQSRP